MSGGGGGGGGERRFPVARGIPKCGIVVEIQLSKCGVQTLPAVAVELGHGSGCSEKQGIGSHFQTKTRQETKHSTTRRNGRETRTKENCEAVVMVVVAPLPPPPPPSMIHGDVFHSFLGCVTSSPAEPAFFVPFEP